MSLTTKDVARLLGVTTQTVINWTEKGFLECIRTPGGHRRYNTESLNIFHKNFDFSIENQMKLKNPTEFINRIVILFSDLDYAGLLKDFLLEYFDSFCGSEMVESNFHIVSSPFQAAYYVGLSDRTYLLIDADFLTAELKLELEQLKNNDDSSLDALVVFCSLSQTNDIKDWKNADSLHVRTSPLVSLIELFTPLLNA